MGLFGKSKSVLVVDTVAVLKTKGVRRRAAPRQLLQLVRALSRVAQREKLGVTAVLAGAPLDKAPPNRIFDGVRVRYAKSEETLSKELLAALKQAGSAGVLVIEDVELEKRVLKAGGSTLRVSTFRKLLDDGGEQNDNSGGGDNSNRSQRRNRRDRGPRNRNQNQQNRPQQQPADEPAEELKSGNDAISQMIDLVE